MIRSNAPGCASMYLMTALIKDRPSPEKPKTVNVKHETRNTKQHAAVIAVALARAELETSAVGTPPVEDTASPWRTLHHQRQLALNRFTRRAR